MKTITNHRPKRQSLPENPVAAGDGVTSILKSKSSAQARSPSTLSFDFEIKVTTYRSWTSSLLLVTLLLLSTSFAQDHRLKPPKDLNGYFPFQVPASAEAWEERATELRLQTRVALGIFPEPARTPLNAVIHGELDRGDYTVAKVYFESLPGFFVTGNLYRPKASGGKKRPGILSPHGHWNDGRFYDNGEANTRAQIERGEEQFVEGGRSPLQARAVGLARLGCVVFHYDMIGNADSTQLSYQLAHKHAKQRLSMNTKTNWGLYSAQAEAHLQSVMGLQTWNSIRALDFLETLDDVDPERLAITGGSGGGTQSMLLAAIDPRVAVSFPAVMVSTSMQGGCTCENATLLRVGTGNIEFAALFAPKPQGMSAADDWTKEMSTKGFPELKKLYALLGAPDKVMLHDRTEFKHNYNQPTRLAMYHWFNQHLALGHAVPIEERDYQRLTREQMSVWNQEHPQPPGGDQFERQLLQTWRKTTEIGQQHSRIAFRSIFRRDIDSAGDCELELKQKAPQVDGYVRKDATLHNTTYQEEVRATILQPADWNGETVLWLHPEGTKSLFNEDGKARNEVRKLLAKQRAVFAIEPLFQGTKQSRKVSNPREFAGYTLGYNDCLLVQRTDDILSAAKFIRDEQGAKRISLLAFSASAPSAAAARMLGGDAFHRASIQLEEFSFGNLLDYRDPNFLPGGAKYGGIKRMLELGSAKLQPYEPGTEGISPIDWLLRD
ncbi:MAG: dienelactone hydrolase [Verrucomicrobiales bacterium]|jgi:dienelactone hydrolase